MFESIYSLIQKYDRIIIHRHKNPDGDALGAQQGLKHILKDNYPNKEILAVGDNELAEKLQAKKIADAKKVLEKDKAVSEQLSK